MKHRLLFVLLVSVTALAGLLAGNVSAQISGERSPSANAGPASPSGTGSYLDYQGRLTNSDGTPINSTMNMVFKMYDSSNTLLWTSATRSVTPVNGLFTVSLGAGSDPGLTSTILKSVASIGVTVGSDAEMSPRQTINTVMGYSANGNAVVGNGSNIGVFGNSTGGTGVYGQSTNYIGVFALTSAPGQPALFASNLGAGPAIEIGGGYIRVQNAGVNSNTAVFIHQAAGGTGFSCINNTYLNGDANAILVVTPRAYWDGSGIVSEDAAVGVYYDVTGISCPAGRWQIYTLNGSSMTTNAQYDVMVVKR